MSDDADLAQRNVRTLKRVFVVFIAMAILPWAYAPLYRRICGVLGVSVPGETQRAAPIRPGSGTTLVAKGEVSLVHFMGVSGQLPIDITPLTPLVWVPIGQTTTVMYRLRNRSARDLDYRAIHMLYPAGDPAFQLVKCFCEDHRIIKAGKTEDWPLVFQLVKPVSKTLGLTVNYTIFDHGTNGKVAAL